MNIIHTVKLKFTPYPWWRSFTVIFQLLLKGYIEVEGVLTDLGDEARPSVDSTVE